MLATASVDSMPIGYNSWLNLRCISSSLSAAVKLGGQGSAHLPPHRTRKPQVTINLRQISFGLLQKNEPNIQQILQIDRE